MELISHDANISDRVSNILKTKQRDSDYNFIARVTQIYDCFDVTYDL